jgi:hypothetical protein
MSFPALSLKEATKQFTARAYGHEIIFEHA